MRRPITPLPLFWWGTSSKAYDLTKGTVGPHVVKVGTLTSWNEEEVRKVHAWLGQVVEDLDQGV